LSRQEAAIHAAQADGVDAGVAQRADQQAIHRTAEHHLDDLGDLGCRDTQTVTLLDGEAEPARPGADRLPAAVHDHGRARALERPRAGGHPIGAVELVAADLDDAHR
jgi:hypothetical protein